LLASAEDLLQTRLFEEIPLADILRRAGVSVGAFYARFSSKDALVPCLYERYDRSVTRGARRVLDPDRWRTRDLEERVHLLFRYAVMLYRRNRGLMRALALLARSDPDIVSEQQCRNRFELYESVARLLLERRDQMRHPDPERAVQFGILMAGATFREKILYDRAPHPQAVATTDRLLAREASRAFLSYVEFRRKR